MNGENKKSIDSIIEQSDLAEFLSNGLKLRESKGYVSESDRPQMGFYDFLEARGDVDFDKEWDEEERIQYYLSTFKGTPPSGIGTDPVTGENYRNWAQRRQTIGGADDPDVRNAFLAKKIIESGKPLPDRIRKKISKKADETIREESRAEGRFIKRWLEDERTNPMNPNFRGNEQVPMPTEEPQGAQAPSVSDLLKVYLSKMFK